MNSELCVKCQGRGYCGKLCPILYKFKEFMPKTKIHFSGSSPPEIFVGKYNYPCVNTGILAPNEYGETEQNSMPEIWHEKNFSIEQILKMRGELIYARFKSAVKDVRKENKLLNVMQEISIADKPVSTEIFLKSLPRQNIHIEQGVAAIGNPAPLKFARLEENPHVPKKVDYLISDSDAKASNSILELYKSNIPVSNVIKVLSAGLLGRTINRKLVPTRWAITAIDDTISKEILNRIRYYSEISEFRVFSSEYLGNHYEFLLMPDKFAFEVLEAKMTGSVWNFDGEVYVSQDYEEFNGRKEYAFDVTGAYYANRLALAEYLDKIKKQACCLVMRECRPEYYAPCGVGILREASRQAFKNKPEIFSSIREALNSCQARFKLPISIFTNKSWLLKEYGKQTRLSSFR